VKAVREGSLDIELIDFQRDRSRLSSRQIGMKRVLQKNLESALAAELVLERAFRKCEPAEPGGIYVSPFVAENGLIVVGLMSDVTSPPLPSQ